MMGKSKEKNQNIQVFVRCRPLNDQEKMRSFSVVETNQNGREVTVKEKLGDKFTKTFTFDRVFASDAKQVDVYKSVVGPLLEEVLTGYNCTVFAYGQTGTGKTFTMEGYQNANKSLDQFSHWEDDPMLGIIPRSLKQLFQDLRVQEVEHTIHVSYLELYNEELFDLIATSDDGSKLRLYEDATRKGSVIIQGLQEVLVANMDDVHAILRKGSIKRQTAATQMNAHSSRSHSVFSVTVRMRESTDDGEELLKTGKLNLVDLAGSENVGKSGATEKRAREAGNINQSLLTLGRVITALVEKTPHVPYRESKLTRLLQDSLGGRTKTSIIATISPSFYNLEETMNTLDYAHRAKNIMNCPEINQRLTKKALIKGYMEEIERLRRDLVATREKNGIFLDYDNYNSLQLQLEQQSTNIREQELQIKAMEDEMEKVTNLFKVTKQELSSTSLQLHATNVMLQENTEKLELTEKTLVDTSQQRDEKEYLLQQHKSKEAILLSQAKTLLTVAQESTAHVDGLHEKLKRRNNFFSNKEQETTSFTENIQTSFESLQGNISSLHDEYESHGEQLLQMTDSQKSAHEKLSQTRQRVLAELCQSQTEETSTLKNQLQQDFEKDLHTINVITKDIQDSTGDQIAAHKEFETKTVLPLFEEQNRLFDEYSSCGKQNWSELLKEAEESIQFGVSSCDQSKIKTDALAKHLNTLHDEMLEDEAAEARNIEAQDQLIARLQELQKERTERCRARAASLQKWKITKDEYVSSIMKTTEECAQMFTEKSKVIHSLQLRSKDQTDKENATSKHIADSKTDILDWMDVSQKKLHARMECLENQMTQYSGNRRDVSRQHVEAVENMNQRILSQTKDDERCKAEEEKCDELLCCYTSKIKEGMKMFEEKLSSMMQNVDQVHGDLNAFYSKRMIKDVPTGLTPQRREFSFPMKLEQTSPHEKLLERYRRDAVELDRAANLPLPLDSPDEEKENSLKSDTPRLGSKLQSLKLNQSTYSKNLDVDGTAKSSQESEKVISTKTSERKPLGLQNSL